MQDVQPLLNLNVKCVLCNSEAMRGDRTGVGPHYYDCPNCGKFRISHTLLTRLEVDKNDSRRLAAVSYHLWATEGKTECVRLDDDTFDRLLEHGVIPSPEEQRELAILACGKESQGRLGRFSVILGQWRARTGSLTWVEFENLLKELEREGIVTLTPLSTHGKYSVTMTFRGLTEYKNVLHGKTKGKRVFMAMPFSPPYGPLVRKAYEAFKAAVGETGFELINPLLEEHRSGLIDHRLQVEIRRSRFLVADLTGKNLGAYWEAGFAQGLGKIVVYTCQDSYFKRKNAIHFDTAHHTVIKWNADDMAEACTQLASLIRNDFPDEAIM